jgi:hypothetical protein
VTRTYFERRAPLENARTKADMNAILHTPPDEAAVARLSQDPRYNSMLRTTCVQLASAPAMPTMRCRKRRSRL